MALSSDQRNLALMKFFNECIELRNMSREEYIKRLERKIKILDD